MSRWTGIFHCEHLSTPVGEGARNLIEAWDAHNSLADEGEFNVLDTYLRGLNAPAQFFIRLFNFTPGETDSLASLTGEPGFTQGYAPQQVLRSSSDWTMGWLSGDAQAISKQVTFNAWAALTVTYAVLATTSDNTGRHISRASLSGTKVLASGEQLRVTYRPSLA